MVQPPFHVYVDVAGTDRSAIVISLPKATRPLSDVGECDIVLSNKAGAYKAAFSEMQRVAVSAARATFHASSDYFTGTDGAAPNAAKWNVTTAVISGNKLKVYHDDAADFCGSNYAITVPFVLSMYANQVSGNDYADIYHFGNNWVLRFTHTDHHFHVIYWDGAWQDSDSGVTWAHGTWYKVIIRVTATTVQVLVYDVYGVLLWDSTALGISAIASSVVCFYTKATVELDIDSYLACSGSSTVTADQLFEGVIDAIEFNAPPDTITLHCMDDNIELERGIDDTYGATTATIVPSFGVTDDFGAAVNLLIPAGWTYTVPDMGWHDYIRININTRRLTALKELINQSGYLGFYVLPMKHLVFVSPTYSSAPDTWTEATAGWTAVNSTVSAVATAVDGSNSLRHASDGGVGLKTLYRIVNINTTIHRFIDFYYGGSAACGTQKLRLYTDTATPKYWERTLFALTTMLTPAASEFGHCRLCLPGVEGLHGWTASASAPTLGDTVIRLEFEFNDAIGLATTYNYIDVVFFHAQQNTSSKYTISNITAANRSLSKPRCYSTIRCISNWGNTSESDATLAALSGTRDYVWAEYGVSTEPMTKSQVYCLLVKQAYNIGGEPISVQIVNPSDMYNVMPGDTLTITIANMDLAAATRILGSRTDSITEVGWRTTLILVAIPPTNPVSELWEIVSKKRFT